MRWFGAVGMVCLYVYILAVTCTCIAKLSYCFPLSTENLDSMMLKLLSRSHDLA